ncbi:hypothetical protein [Escherichia coli]|uniref:hypothetical protein n=1 Tax=Escherichia coli TaxID=562 RepID=UPI003890BFE9
MIGYHPQVILAGRRINDSMGKYIAEQTVKKMIAANISIKGSKILVMGLTLKKIVLICVIAKSLMLSKN